MVRGREYDPLRTKVDKGDGWLVGWGLTTLSAQIGHIAR